MDSSTKENKRLCIRVAVGSKNPCKLEAVRLAFESVFQDCEVSILSENAKSEVSDQPMGDVETKQGAINRARNTWNIFNGTDSDEERCDFAVGLEGGCEIMDHATKSDLWVMAWMAVIGQKKNMVYVNSHGVTTRITLQNSDDSNNDDDLVIGYGKTATFQLPSEVARLVKEEGLELGHADDQVFQRVNSKHGGGTVGILTHGLIDRSKYYQHAIQLALVRTYIILSASVFCSRERVWIRLNSYSYLIYK